MRPLVPLLLLIGILSVAVRSDLASRRIPNALILSGLAAAAAWHGIAAPGAWSFDPLAPGGLGVSGFLAGTGLMLAMFFPIYLFRILGAGDVKLLAVVGGLFGASQEHWVHLLQAAALVLVCGGLLSVIRMLMLGLTSRVLGNLRRMLASAVWHSAGLPSPHAGAVETADRMPYALAIAVGSVLFALASSAGWL